MQSMLSKQQIMQEYRHFVARREDMTRAYTQQHPPVIDVASAAAMPPDDALPAPPSACRAPASLTW
jgi:hypothetical protein